MKKSPDIFGGNGTGKMQNDILQGYACVWMWWEVRVVYNLPNSLPGVWFDPKESEATRETLLSSVNAFESIDSEINEKKDKWEKAKKNLEAYNKLKDEQSKLKEWEEFDPVKKAELDRLQGLLKQDFKIDFGLATDAGRFIGEAAVWIPKKAMEIVAGTGMGLAEGLGGGKLLNGLTNKATQLYYEVSAQGDLLISTIRWGKEGKIWRSPDEFLADLIKEHKVQAMQVILLQVTRQKPQEYEIQNAGGKWQIVDLKGNEVVGLQDLAANNQEIIALAFFECLLTNPNAFWKEQLQLFMQSFRNEKQNFPKGITPEAIQKFLQELDQNNKLSPAERAEIVEQYLKSQEAYSQRKSEIKAKETELDNLEKALKTDAENLAEAKKALADLFALEKEFLAKGNVKEAELLRIENKILELQELESSYRKAELDKRRRDKWEKFLEAEMGVRTEIAQIFKNRMAIAVLEEGMEDYADLDDTNLTKLFKFVFRDLLWRTIFGVKEKSKYLPSQGNLLDQLVVGVIRTDADEATFQKLKTAFVEDLKAKAGFGDAYADQIGVLLQKGRDEYNESKKAPEMTDYQADPTTAKMLVIAERLKERVKDASENNLKILALDSKDDPYTKLQADIENKQTKLDETKGKIDKTRAEIDWLKKGGGGIASLEELEQNIENSRHFDQQQASRNQFLQTPLGQFFLHYNRENPHEAQFAKSMIELATEEQTKLNQTHDSVAALAKEMSTYKPVLSEKLMDALKDLPLPVQAGGLILAVLMIAKSKGGGKILGGLALTGIAGEILTRAMSDGDQGIVDFIHEKTAGLTGDAKDQIAKMLSLDASNAIFRFSESYDNPEKREKMMLTLTMLSETRLEEMLDPENVRANDETKTLDVKRSFYEKIRSKPNFAATFQKGGIDYPVFSEAVGFFFETSMPEGEVDSPYLGYKHWESRDQATKSRTVLEVILSSGYTHLKKIGELPKHQNNYESVLRKRTEALGVWGFIPVEQKLDSFKGTLGGYEVEYRSVAKTPANPEGFVWILEGTALADTEELKRKVAEKKTAELADDFPEGATSLIFDGEYFEFGEYLKFKSDASEEMTDIVIVLEKETPIEVRALEKAADGAFLQVTIIVNGKDYLVFIDEKWRFVDDHGSPVGDDQFKNFLKSLEVEESEEESWVEDQEKIDTEKIKQILWLDPDKFPEFEFSLDGNNILISHEGNSLEVVFWRFLKIDGFVVKEKYVQDITPIRTLEFMAQVYAKPALNEAVTSRFWTTFYRMIWTSSITFGSPAGDITKEFAGEETGFIDESAYLLDYWYLGGRSDSSGIDFVGRYKQIEGFYLTNQRTLRQMVERVKDYPYFKSIRPMNAENTKSAFYLEGDEIMFAGATRFDKPLGEIDSDFDLNTFDFDGVPEDQAKYYLMLALNRAWAGKATTSPASTIPKPSSQRSGRHTMPNIPRSGSSTSEENPFRPWHKIDHLRSRDGIAWDTNTGELVKLEVTKWFDLDQFDEFLPDDVVNILKQDGGCVRFRYEKNLGLTKYVTNAVDISFLDWLPNLHYLSASKAEFKFKDFPNLKSVYSRSKFWSNINRIDHNGVAYIAGKGYTGVKNGKIIEFK